MVAISMGRTHEERVELFEANKRLVWWCLKRWPPRFAHKDEVEQEMMILLWKLTDTWDPARAKFSNIAVASMFHAEKLVLNRKSSRRLWRVANARLGGVVVAFSGLPNARGRDEVRNTDGRYHAGYWGGRDGTAANEATVRPLLAGPDTVAAWIDEEDRQAAPARVEQMAAAAGLSARCRRVIDLRFTHGLSYRAAARILGLSGERVRQLEARALDRMRRAAERGVLKAVLP